MRDRAIYNTHPNVASINAGTQAFNINGELVQLNESLIEVEVARLQADWDSKEYQRLREKEYPPLADLADAIYWQAQGDESKMTAYIAACEAVKVKYPKGV
jgi:hypothetical protein